jgi:hypothetical protein
MDIDTLVRLAQLVGAACFVLGLHLMNSPASARNGNLLSAGRHGRGGRRHAPRSAHPRRVASAALAGPSS